MFLNCKGYTKDTEADCRTYSANGNHANRYDIRTASFHHVSKKHNFTPITIIVPTCNVNQLTGFAKPSHAASTTQSIREIFA